MILIREESMINKDITTALSQFSDNATWINSQGYYFVGKEEVQKFHNMLATTDTVDYYYEAGTPYVRMVDPTNALVYYAWKMFWYRSDNPSDTVRKEIGLMTLSAQKREGDWKWIAVSNQYTPWFLGDFGPVNVEH